MEGGLNTYGYVGGNPVNKIDPFGLHDIPLPFPWPRAPENPVEICIDFPVLCAIIIPLKVIEAVCPPNNKPDCHKASPWDLKQAGIVGKGAEHKYKKEHGAVPESHFDICKCTDGSIRIAKVGQCGKTSDFWD